MQYRYQIKDKVQPLSSLVGEGDSQTAGLTTGTGGGEGTGSSGSKTENGSQDGEGQAKGEGGGEPTLDPEVVKLLVEARDYLVHENAVYRRWMRAAKFTKDEGRFFVMLVHKYLPQKEALIRKIENSEKAKEFRVLELVKLHLGDQAKADKETKVGGSDYIQRLEALERRLRGALIDKDSLVENLNNELKRAKVDEQQISAVKEVITQEQEAAKKEGKSSIKLDIMKEEQPKQQDTQPPPPPGNP